MFSDALLIILIAMCTALLGEGLTYVLVYRSDEYKRLKHSMEQKTKKLERKKEIMDGGGGTSGFSSGGATAAGAGGGASSATRNQKRKIEREEERLKSTNRDLSMFRMKSMLAIGFVFTALLSTFSSIFEGRVVAKLPFEPLTWIQGLSHRNLAGDDYTDCSFIFLYILCTMSIRQNLQKFLGFTPSRALNRQTQGAGPMAGLFGGAASGSQSQFSYFR